jgi:pullulanase
MDLQGHHSATNDIDLEIELPEIETPLPLIGALRATGHRIAEGETTAPQGQKRTLLTLRMLADYTEIPPGPCELWLTLDRDGLRSPFPGFGDLYRKEIVNPLAASRRIVIRNPRGWREKALSAPENRVTFHYHRFDGLHRDATIWTWDGTGVRTPAENELLPVGEDHFGPIFQLDRSDYGASAPERIGYVFRVGADWSMKDGEDRFWSPSHSPEIYIIGGRKKVYRTQPDIQPHVLAAYLDAPDRLVIEVTHPLRAEDPDSYQVLVTDARQAPVPLLSCRLMCEAGRSTATRIEATMAAGLGPAGHGFRVAVRGFGNSVQIRPRGVLFDPALFYEESATLGAHYTPQETKFSVFAPLALHASVVLYDKPAGSEGRTVHTLHPAGKGIWSGVVPGDLEGKFYMYQFTGDGHDPHLEVVDPYAVNTVHSSTRARITDLSKTNPPGWEASRSGPVLAHPVDLIVYEAHVRDFSIAPSSGIRNAGRYLGFTEENTRLPEDPSIVTGLDHLVELGITHVQLLPVQDFDNDELNPSYDWGYMTRVFHSPEGWYATNPDDESRVRELKQLVQALHDRGIGVIMDVVYNHTASFAPFNACVAGYYYRLHPDGSYSNGSGCGNEFHSEAPMARKYIVDTLRHFVEEYGIDGFRFDLMALIDLDTMLAVERELRKIKPDIVLYGEPWQAAPGLCIKPSSKEAIRGTPLGAFNDEYRNALKGFPEGEGVGFIQSGYSREVVEQGIAGFRHGWPASPGQTINYMTCHDNLVLYDKLKLSKPYAKESEILAMMKLGYLLLLTSQGVPFLHAGEEFGRSKGGHHNSYNAPDSVNQIDWSLKKKNADLYEYVKSLVQMRKAHPLFRLRTYEEINARVRFHPTPRHESILFTIDGRGLDLESWHEVCVVANAHDTESLTFALPAGEWEFAIPTSETGRSVEGTLSVPPKNGVVLHRL